MTLLVIGWAVPLTLYAVLGLPMLHGAWLMSKPGRYLEDKYLAHVTPESATH